MTPADAARVLDDLIEKIDGRFRSSSRFIPADVLHRLSFAAVPAADRVALAEFDRDVLLAGLRRSRTKLDLNRGVVENILKIHQITRRCLHAQPLHPDASEQSDRHATSDGVAGLDQRALDALTSDFPPESSARAHEYDHDLDQLVRLGVRSALDTDWYKFKMAAIIFEYGLHRTKRVTYNMFSRGKENRAYFVVGGTSLAVDAIPLFHFDESDVRYIQGHPQMQDVAPGFFDYLRTWRFGRDPDTGRIEDTAWVRAVPEGTIVFANQTILEVTADPLSATLIECLLSPLVDTVTTSATKVARIVGVAGGAQVVEGGTRRSGHARLGAYGAMIGGAVGTSNAWVSAKVGTTPFGSMEHALFGLFPNERQTMIAFDRVFKHSTQLIDEEDIPRGARNAVRAAGLGLAGVRTDSVIAGLGLGGTTKALRELFAEFRMLDPKLTVSDRIDEYALAELNPANSAHNGVLVGTEVQNPSDANGSNIVFKLVQVIDRTTGVIRPIAKTSVGKVGIPGETEIFRVMKLADPDATDVNPRRRACHDVIAIKGETIENGVPLLVPALSPDGRRTLPRVPITESAQRARDQFASFDPSVTDVRAKRGAYEVRLSPKLAAHQNGVLRSKARQPYRVGVLIGSFDPVTTAHVRLMTLAKNLFTFDRALVVPAHQDPVHGKTYRYPAEERVLMLHQKFDDLGVEVDEREVRGPPRPFTLDTLCAIKADAVAHDPRAEIYVVVGDDVFDQLIDESGRSSWIKHRRALLNGEYSWVVHRRHGPSELHVGPGALDPSWRRLSPRHFEHDRTGAVIESFDLRVGHAVSSTVQRQRAGRVTAILHGVDLQETFWERREGRPPGTMAVPGSNAILDNALRLVRLARLSPGLKSIYTKDYHTELEARDPRWNPEFEVFPPHGMAERTGPAGHEIVWELKDEFPQEQRLIVPHHAHRRAQRPEDDRLELIEFDAREYASEIVDPDVQLVIQKNGPDSFDFMCNPHAREILTRIPARRVFVYGVATDYCVKDAVRSYLRLGFDTFLVTDAVAGIDATESARWLGRLVDAGARLVTTDQVMAEFAPAATAEGPGPGVE